VKSKVRFEETHSLYHLRPGAQRQLLLLAPYKFFLCKYVCMYEG